MKEDSDQILWKRRDALKLIALATAGVATGGRRAGAQNAGHLEGPRGTLSDPKLLAATADWPRELTPAELETLAVLCDVIIPADDESPAASEVKVHDFINEWISAPYPRQQADQILIRGGLLWLDSESRRRFGSDFAHMTDAQRTSLCEEMKLPSAARDEMKAASRFFSLVRNLAATGYYTTGDVGWKDIGYVGNKLGFIYTGTPDEVISKLGLSTPVTTPEKVATPPAAIPPASE